MGEAAAAGAAWGGRAVQEAPSSPADQKDQKGYSPTQATSVLPPWAIHWLGLPEWVKKQQQTPSR